MDEACTPNETPSSLDSRQPSRTKRPTSSGSQSSVISTGSAADKYLEYVPRISSPLTLPPIAPPSSEHGHGGARPTSWSPLGMSGPSRLDTAIQGGKAHRNSASDSGAGSKGKRRSKLSSSTFLGSFPVVWGGRKVDSDVKDGNQDGTVVLSCTAVGQEDPGLPAPSPRYRKLRMSDEGLPMDYSSEGSWGRTAHRWSKAPEASTSHVTLAQLLAEELEQIAANGVELVEGEQIRTGVDPVEMIVEEEGRSETKEGFGSPAGKAKRHRKQKSSVSGTVLQPSVPHRHKEETQSFASTTSIEAGCIPCSIDVRRIVRSWLFRLKVSKRDAEISPALQALVERPMSPEEYHAYFLSLYISANEQESRHQVEDRGNETS